MKKYYVVLLWDKHGEPEYCLKTGLYVDAPNEHDAFIAARKEFAEGYGLEERHISKSYINSCSHPLANG